MPHDDDEDDYRATRSSISWSGEDDGIKIRNKWVLHNEIIVVIQ